LRSSRGSLGSMMIPLHPELSGEQRRRLAERASPRYSDFAAVRLPELPHVPGMISPAEQRYLYWLASCGYTGSASVVEVGPWLGCSTVHLAAGLRDAGFHDSLCCIDQFALRSAHSLKASLPLRRGDDFQPYFESNVRPVYPRIRVIRTVIKNLVWSGGPIEILVLDAPKKLEDISAALAAFGPSLVPGLSLMVLQDYLHAPSYALPAVVGRLSRELELVHVVEDGSTVSFAVREPLRYERAQPREWNFLLWSSSDTGERWRRLMEALPERPRAWLEPGLALMLFDQGAVKEACKAIRAVRFDPAMAARWQRYSSTPFYDLYGPLFESLGIRPNRSAWQRVRSIKRRLRRRIWRRLVPKR